MISNKILSAILFFFLSCSGPAGDKIDTLSIGAKAPKLDKELKDVSGKERALREIGAENGLLVIFSCNTCPFVKAWEDRYPEIRDQASEKDVGMALINSNAKKRDQGDGFADMKARHKNKGYGCPYLLDENSKLANAFGAKTTPHVFLFDDNFELVYKGAIDDNYENAEAVEEPYLKNALNALEEGGKIDPQQTKAIGCSIKRADTQGP